MQNLRQKSIHNFIYYIFSIENKDNKGMFDSKEETKEKKEKEREDKKKVDIIDKFRRQLFTSSFFLFLLSR